MNALNQLKRFFELADEQNLSGTDQLLYLQLFNRFNRALWKKSLKISDRELHESLRLYDSSGKPAAISTMRNARTRLKNKGFIDYTAGNGAVVTEYRLIELAGGEETTLTQAKTALSTNSPEVLKAWEDCRGTKLTGGVALGLIELENIYGKEALVTAIIDADKANRSPNLSYNFLKAVLEKRGAKRNVQRGKAENWEGQRPAWLDE